MWTAIYIAQSKKMAEKVEKLLTEEGMLVKVQSVGKRFESERGYYEILVPECEAEEAQNILYEMGY